jgi:hypothetical protein
MTRNREERKEGCDEQPSPFFKSSPPGLYRGILQLLAGYRKAPRPTSDQP